MPTRQASLFPGTAPLARASDPESSKAAGKRYDRMKRDSDKAAVLSAVRRTPGLSSKALAARHGLDRYMVARRLPDLERDGLVRRDGEASDGCTAWWAVSDE